METLIHQILSGLAAGGIYASVALALVMIYQSTHHINFAQGEMAMFATYCSWALIQAGMPYWVAFVLTTIGAFGAGILLQRIILKPFEKASVLANVIVFIGLLVIFNSIAGWIFGHSLKTFPSPFPSKPLFGGLLSNHEFGELCITLGVLTILYCFFRFTKLGLAMRAAALSPDSSRLVGIRVSWMLALGWGIASAVGAIAGMMVAPIVFLDPNMMGGILIYGFASALLGGINNPWGAVVGGLIVGVLENLIGAYVAGTDMKLTVALILIVTVLTLKPSGLLGKTTVVRV